MALAMASGICRPAYPAPAVPKVEPNAAAAALVETLTARQMGVDRAGNLWAWTQSPREMVLVSPSGTVRAKLHTAQAKAVDADTEWGVLLLVSDGLEAQWWSWDGRNAGSVRFSGQMTDLCWMGPGLLAVSPQDADHRVEVWDLARHSRVRSFGRETALHRVPGVTRMRSVLLRYDFDRQLLYTLESYLGQLEVFDAAGAMVRTEETSNPRKPSMDAWLREIDQRARNGGDMQALAVFDLFLALGPDGMPWIAQYVPGGKSLTLVRMAAGRNEPKQVDDETCPSPRFVFWGDALVFYRDPLASYQPVCTHLRSRL